MNKDYKEVLFDKYCPICKHTNKKEDEEPCDRCLDAPLNLHSEKPIEFEEATKKVKMKLKQ